MQGRAQTANELGFLATQQTGKLVFRQRIWYRRYCAQYRRRVTAQYHSDREGLPRVGQLMIPEIQGAATVRQPAHDQFVGPQYLLAVNAQVLACLVGPARYRKAPGHQWRHVTRPAVLYRQAGEIHILAFEYDFLTGR